MAELLQQCSECGDRVPDKEGNEAWGGYRGQWFCHACWRTWDQEPESPPIDLDSCVDPILLRSMVRQLSSQLEAARTLRLSSPCTTAGEHWSEMSSMSRAWLYWRSWCPNCKRPLNVSVRRSTDEGGRQSSCPTGPPSRSDCPPRPAERARTCRACGVRIMMGGTR